VRGTALLEGTSLKVQLQDEPPIHFSTDAGGGGFIDALLAGAP
jgi:hypothetical protein